MKPTIGERTETDLLLPVRKCICIECPFAVGSDGWVAMLLRFGDKPKEQFGCFAGPAPDEPQDGQVQCRALQDWNFPKWSPLALQPGMSAFQDYDGSPSGRVRLGDKVKGARVNRVPHKVLKLERHGGLSCYRLRTNVGGFSYVSIDRIVEAFAPRVKTE